MQKIEVAVKRLHKDALLPYHATAGAACFDIAACGIGEGESVTLDYDKNPSHVFKTGLAFAVPAGFVMNIYSRSGHGFKHGVRLANSVGKIDSDYRGELMVKLTIDKGGQPLTIRDGDRIAQGEVVRDGGAIFVVAEELPSTERGAGGFGSTGATHRGG